jgi:pimeloyl-ACP methyl ester carboxylesterase
VRLSLNGKYANIPLRDPLLVNTLAKTREVILFDNTGVGRSSGAVPATFKEWATDLMSFIKALNLDKIDLFGFSMGGLAGKYRSRIYSGIHVTPTL